MVGVMLLEEARAAGLTVQAQGDRLRIRGPRRAEEVALRLIAHKAAVLEVLAAAVDHSPQPADADLRALRPDWQELWAERAAIRQFDGGFSEVDANALAFVDVLEVMRRVETDPRGCEVGGGTD
jgi:hypothetical protein